MFTKVQRTLFTLRRSVHVRRWCRLPAIWDMRTELGTSQLLPLRPLAKSICVCVCAIPLSCQVLPPPSCRPLSRPLTAPSNPLTPHFLLPAHAPPFYPLCFVFPYVPLSSNPGPDVPSPSSVSTTAFRGPSPPVPSLSFLLSLLDPFYPFFFPSSDPLNSLFLPYPPTILLFRFPASPPPNQSSCPRSVCLYSPRTDLSFPILSLPLPPPLVSLFPIILLSSSIPTCLPPPYPYCPRLYSPW